MWAHCDMKIQIPHFLLLTQLRAPQFVKYQRINRKKGCIPSISGMQPLAITKKYATNIEEDNQFNNKATISLQSIIIIVRHSLTFLYELKT